MPTEYLAMRSPNATSLRADAEEFWPTADGRTRRTVEHGSDRLASAHIDLNMPKAFFLPGETAAADLEDSKTLAGPAPVSETPTFRTLC